MTVARVIEGSAQWMIFQPSEVTLQDSDAVLALFEVAEGVSRVHSGRRFFEYLARHDIDIPVIHHRRFESGGLPWHSSTPLY
jgi:hypothetical protein